MSPRWSALSRHLPLLATLAGTAATAAGFNPELSVAVRRQVPKVAIGSTRGMVVTELIHGRELTRPAPGKALQLESTRDGIRVAGLGVFSRLAFAPQPGSLLLVDGSGYRGKLRAEEDPFGRINVVDLVDLESYLRGVVAAEMLVSSPMEALKAQAVVARTFAYKNRTRFMKERGYGLTADTDSQVYRGVAGEDPRTDQAVRETAGLVIEAGGQLVDAYYHQACGGRTQDNEAVWGGRAWSHLRAVDCAHCGKLGGLAGYGEFDWSLRLGFPEVRAALIAAGLQVGPIEAIEQAREPCGRAIRLVVHHGQGRLELSPSRLRELIGNGRIKSTHFHLVESGGGPDPSAPSTNPEASIRSIIAGYMTTRPTTERAIVLTGKGSGHGVGLCQWGARAQAEAGLTFRAILQAYYRGVSVASPTRGDVD